jgi:hypothetical protein
MPRQDRASALRGEVSPALGTASNAMRFTVNISQEVGDQLKSIAFDNRVSESSVIEVALRQLLRRVSAPQLGAFLRQNGACLRRRS